MARPHTWQFLREKRNRGIRKRSYSVLRSPLAEVVINNSGGRAVSTKWACCDPDARRPSPVPLTVVREDRSGVSPMCAPPHLLDKACAPESADCATHGQFLSLRDEATLCGSRTSGTSSLAAPGISKH